MRWSQFLSFIAVFNMRKDSKKFMLASGIVTPRLLQFLQSKDEFMGSEIDVPVSAVISDEFYSLKR